MPDYIILPQDTETLPLPQAKFPCPICGAAITLIVHDPLEAADDGSGGMLGDETEYSLECTTQPDIESPDWHAWHTWHYAMPYVDWLPLEAPVHTWVNARYRWALHA